MLRMKYSASWVYYDIPHIYLFSELHIISYEIVENIEKINLINLIEKTWFNRNNLIYLKHLDFFSNPASTTFVISWMKIVNTMDSRTLSYGMLPASREDTPANDTPSSTYEKWPDTCNKLSLCLSSREDKPGIRLIFEQLKSPISE